MPTKKDRRKPVKSYRTRVKTGLAATEAKIREARRNLVEKLSAYMKVKHAMALDLDTNPNIMNDEVAKAAMEFLRDEERALLREDLKRIFKERPLEHRDGH